MIPTTLFEALLAFRSTANLIERIDSAKRDNGISVAAQKTPERRTMVLCSKTLSDCCSRVSCFGLGSFKSGTREMHGKCSVLST